MSATLAFGITAAERADHARLGTAIERLGFAELWVNDTRQGDGLATLAAIEAGTRSLRFGVGVISLSEQSPAQILERLASAKLPTDRLTLGIGSGSSASLQLIRDAVAELRRREPDRTIAVAAVGPRMAHLAGEIADAVVANWALPARLAWIRERVAEGAHAAGRPPPRLIAYVRTAVGAGAADRLETEMNRYRGYGDHYARAFDAQPGGLIGVAVESGSRADITAALTPFQSVVDTVVVRALAANDSVDEWLQVASAAAPATSHHG
ncbi:MAG: LLM class flavin-dependent oxidoreductase [Chloroflexota bacterium]|nr:LLM class flavin-dependent oxidoreductase [Chloroflexota bacterium]